MDTQYKQLIPASYETRCLVDRNARSSGPAVIDPVPILDHCRSLVGCHQFLFIFLCITHFEFLRSFQNTV